MVKTLFLISILIKINLNVEFILNFIKKYKQINLTICKIVLIIYFLLASFISFHRINLIFDKSILIILCNKIIGK